MATDEHLHKFPPFPAPPEGTTIVPFSAFTPVGYRRVTDPSGTEVEVDAYMGIPTIKVLNEREAGQKRKSKRKKRTAGNVVDEKGRLIPWWEEWEEGEASRVMGQGSFHGLTSLEDRVCMAADDFRVGRAWPEIAHGVRLLWDKFRLYIGLISSIPVYIKPKKSNGQVNGPENTEEASDEGEDVPKSRETKVNVQDYLEQAALPGKQLEPNPDESTAEAQRLRAFLDDMEKTVKIFLSSYMFTTGLIWTDKNLFTAPTVLHFFLRFMLRSRVFADSTEHLENLERAVSVAAVAQKELPLTARFGKVLPGTFDQSCKELWGTRGSLSIQISVDLPPANVDDNPTNSPSSQSNSSSAFEADLKEQDVEVVPSREILNSSIAKQVLDEYNNIPEEEYTTASWTDVAVPWLMQLLGPTTLPLMMTTGIVESSTRRIRKIIAPGARTESAEGNPTRNVSAVEEVLDDKFFKVVLGPWVRCVSEEMADFSEPVISPGSNGTVGTEEDAWNPYRDDLSVLVEGDVAEHLVTGMGLGGTWVQMVPETGDKKHPGECYWYIESLVASVPSYYTEGKISEKVLAGAEDDDDD